MRRLLPKFTFRSLVSVALFFGIVAVDLTLTPSATANGRIEADPMTTADVSAWNTMPFSAREWARQALLPYRDVPLKNGGKMSVQDAYDLYLRAGQPAYPDMSTPGLVTPEEVSEQIKLSKLYNPPQS